MNTWIYHYMHGFVVCRVRGEGLNRFINQLTHEKFHIWNIRFSGESSCTFFIHLNDFFRLRSVLRQNRCRLRILKRDGWPFVIARLTRRKSFMVGPLLFLIGLYILTSMVWKIEITGNEQIHDREVLEIASELGVQQGALISNMPGLDNLKRNMLERLDGASWVGVEIIGTKVKFEIVERVVPDEPKAENPRNLVSSKDAIIMKILAEKGQPMVKVNERVRKGDLLISGRLGEGDNQQIIVAKGIVKGLVWYKTSVTLPMVQKRKEYTGNYRERAYIAIGNRALKVKGYQDIPFKKYESKLDEKVVKWREYPLPVRWIDEKVLEVTDHEVELSAAEAIAIAKERARADVLVAAGSKAVIESEKILHRNVDNGKVELTVLFEVVEDIASEQPIIQGD